MIRLPTLQISKCLKSFIFKLTQKNLRIRKFLEVLILDTEVTGTVLR